jgi:hypothetical protein
VVNVNNILTGGGTGNSNNVGTFTFTPTAQITTSNAVVNSTALNGYNIAMQVNGDNEVQQTQQNGGQGTIPPFKGMDVGIGSDNIQVQFDNLTPGHDYEIAVYSGGTGNSEGVTFFDGAVGSTISLQTAATALNNKIAAQPAFVAVGVGVTNANYVTDTMVVGVNGELSFDLNPSNIVDASSLASTTPTVADDTTVLNGFGIVDLTTAAAPEPSTYMLFIAGGLVLLLLKVRRSRQV